MHQLDQCSAAGVSFLTDAAMYERHGILVAFSARSGGVSTGAYASLNLAAHVGDEAAAVDENRGRLLDALGIAALRPRLTTSEQVHGERIRDVTAREAGAGAFALGGARPLAATDAVLTTEAGVPLLMLYADCVPVVVVATAPERVVGIAHCGWRGALAGLAGKTAGAVAARAGCAAAGLLAYIGPHIGECHYRVSLEMVSQFEERFATIAPARDRLDLGAVVSESLNEVGVLADNTVSSGICTAERIDAFYSYRGEGTTGRHGALAVILGPGR